MHRFDAPLAPGDPGQVSGASPAGAQAGDGVDDLLGNAGAGGVVAVPLDAHHPGDVREVQATGPGDPQGALDDAAVPVVHLAEVRLAGAGGLDGVVDRTLQRRLVPFDVQEVIAAPAAFIRGAAMYCAVARWECAASPVTTASVRSTGPSSSLTWVVSSVSSGIACWAMITFSACSMAANSLTCWPSPCRAAICRRSRSRSAARPAVPRWPGRAARSR